MTIHYIIYILLLLLFLPFHYWCDWFMRTRNIDLRYMFIIVMCAFGVVATWTYMYECTCTYKMLRLCSQWRVSTLLYSFVIRNWRIGFICSDIIILRCMNVTNKANMCFAYGQSVLTSSRWRRLFGCCCCCGGFFFFAPSFVLYLIYVVSRSIGVRNRNAIYTYICWSSILAWPTINTVCLFPALYHTICIPLYYISIPSSCAPQMTQVIQAIVLFNSWMFTSYLAAHRNIAKASVCGKRFANARNCTVYGWGTTNQIN